MTCRVSAAGTSVAVAAVIRSLVISHKLLGTDEWFVIHHTNHGGAEVALTGVPNRTAAQFPTGAPLCPAVVKREPDLRGDLDVSDPGHLCDVRKFSRRVWRTDVSGAEWKPCEDDDWIGMLNGREPRCTASDTTRSADG